MSSSSYPVIVVSSTKNEFDQVYPGGVWVRSLKPADNSSPHDDPTSTARYWYRRARQSKPDSITILQNSSVWGCDDRQLPYTEALRDLIHPNGERPHTPMPAAPDVIPDTNDTPDPVVVDVVEEEQTASHAASAPVPVLFDNIPDEMKRSPRWVMWKREPRTDRDGMPYFTKVPYQVTGRRAKSDDPKTWTTFDAVAACLQDNPGKYAGIGFNAGDDPDTGKRWFGADVDKLYDPDTGKWKDPEALDLLLGLGSYAEYSPSGTGGRVFGWGYLNGDRRKNGDFECYDGFTKEGKPGGRFLTVTGNRIEGAPAEIRDIDPEGLAAYERKLAGDDTPKIQHRQPTHTPSPELSDDDIIGKCLAAANNTKFSALWRGDTSGYPSPSEAELALCSILGFYTQDRIQLDRLMRRSGLYREKWDTRIDYVTSTIEKALKGTGDTWTPGHRQQQQKQQPVVPDDGNPDEMEAVRLAGDRGIDAIVSEGAILVAVTKNHLEHYGILQKPETITDENRADIREKVRETFFRIAVSARYKKRKFSIEEKLSSINQKISHVLENDEIIQVIRVADTFVKMVQKAPSPGHAPKQPGTDHGTDTTTGIDRTYHLTDAGNSDRFVDQHRDAVLHCAPLKSWYVWTGKTWEDDVTNRVLEMATWTAKSLYAEAASSDESSKIAKWAMQTESLQRRRHMIDGSVFQVAVRPEELDARPELFNLQNGTLNLETYELKPHNPADRLTMIAGIDYVPGAKCPKWDDHLSTIFDNDDEVIQSFQEMCGYALLQFNPEQIAIVLWGLGANGKSETMRVISSVMGSYGINIESKTLMKSKHDDPDRARPDVVRMKGARFITCTEPGEKDELSENLVKAFTGDDTITARPLYAKPIQFQPGGKIFMSTNHRPRIRGTDDGIWRRIWLYPFVVVIAEDKRIRDYGAILFREEGPGIFNWMIEGLKRYQARGSLKKPAKVEEAVREYRIENNPLGRFISDRCVCEDTENVEYGKVTFYKNWEEYCKDRGWTPGTKKRVGQNMLSLFKDRKDEHGNGYWLGIRRKTDDEMGKDRGEDEELVPGEHDDDHGLTSSDHVFPKYLHESVVPKVWENEVRRGQDTITTIDYKRWLVAHGLSPATEPGKYERITDKKPSGWCGCVYDKKTCSDYRNPSHFSSDPILKPLCDQCFTEVKRMYESIQEVTP